MQSKQRTSTTRLSATGSMIWLALAVISTLSPQLATADSPANGFWIRGAFMIDPATDGDPRHVDVRVEHGTIVRLQDAQGAAELGSQDLDAAGRFLVPGFIDTHAHISLGPVHVEIEDGAPAMKIERDAEVERRSLLSLLAHGVTTVRDPGGNLDILASLKKELEQGDRVGPRLRIAGEVIDRTVFAGLTASVDGPEAVRTEVRRQAAAGADWIKLYTSLSREELRAGIEEARAQGVRSVAHLQRISWTEAADMGLDALVHGIPGSELLLPEAHRHDYLPDLHGTRFLYSWLEHVDFESPEIRDMLAAMKKAKMTVDLTLVAFDAMVRGDEPWRTRRMPELEMAAPSLAENWRTLFTFNVGWVPEDYTRAEKAWPRALQFARLLHESGIHLTVGTDANNPWTVPGPSFHRELELLAEAGFTPREILRMATRNGAESLGLDDEIGRIAPGYAADLVLLDRDPLDDISASRDIVWVMRFGRVFKPADLNGQVLEGPVRNPS